MKSTVWKRKTDCIKLRSSNQIEISFVCARCSQPWIIPQSTAVRYTKVDTTLSVCLFTFEMGRVISKSKACVALSLLCLQSVCGQHTEGDLHQCGRLHLPGSLWEGPPHLAVAARPLRLSRALTWWRGSRESISGSSTLVPWSPLPPPRHEEHLVLLGEEPSTGLIALPRVLHSCSSVPCGLSLITLL